MDKVIKDGKVAVLYSPGYGAGWSTWFDKDELLFHPEVVRLVEENRRKEIPELIEKLYPEEHLYCGGAVDLEIEWVDQGDQFEIREYDGYESVHVIGKSSYITA